MPDAVTEGRRWLVYLPVDELPEDPRNPKQHADADIDASLERFGYTEPVLLDERTGMLISGHGRKARVIARREAGKPPPSGVVVDDDGVWRVPVTRGWASKNDIEAAAYLVAANELTARGGWQADPLAALLSEIRRESSLDGIGFTSREVDGMLADANRRAADPPAPDEDEIPVAPPSRTASGQLWLLGPHRLYVGESDHGAIPIVLGGQLADMVWTDPPYGVEYVGKTGDALTIDNDDLDAAGLTCLLDAAFTDAVAGCKAGAVWFVAAPSGLLIIPFLSVLERLGVFRQMHVWVKDRFVLGHADYHYRHEALIHGEVPRAPGRPRKRYVEGHQEVAFGWVPGDAHQPPGTRTWDTVWEVPRPTRNAEHPTMKPVELIARAIGNHCIPDDLVLDPFGGSGSTLLAAHRMNCRAALVEKDPVYADVILARWEMISGEQATLAR